MPIDARILLAGQPVQPDNYLDNAIKAQQPYNSMMENKLMARKMQAADDESARTNMLSGLVRSSIDPTTGQPDNKRLMSALAQSGMYNEMQDVQKTQLESMQQERLAAKDKVDRGIQVLDYGIKKSGMVRDQADWNALRQELITLSPEAANGLPEQYSVEGIKQFQDMALTAKDKVLQHQNELEFAYKQQNDQANRAVTMRGQDQSALNRAVPPPMTVGQQYDYDKKVKEDAMAKQSTVANLQDTIDNIDRLTKIQDVTPTGPVIGSTPVAALRKAIPGEDADNLAKLEKGYAEISLKLIGSLKQGGTTLGALSEKEGQWLKDASESISSTGTVNKEMLERGKQLATEQMKRLGASPIGHQDDNGENDPEYQKYLRGE